MKPGIHKDLPFEDYLAIDALNCSLLKEIAKSPGHLAYRREYPIEPTPVMVFGSAVDCLVFEGYSAFASQYALKPDDMDMRTKVGKLWKASIGDKQIVPETAETCAAAVVDNREASALIDDSSAQLSIVWEDRFTGLLLKGRPDAYLCTNFGVLVDLKTTDNADPEQFARKAHGLRYHWQAAMYLDGMTKLTGERHDEFVYVVVERDPPHRVEVMRLGQAEIELGRDEYRRALQLYAECKANDNWPTSSGEVQDLHFPAWAFK